MRFGKMFKPSTLQQRESARWRQRGFLRHAVHYFLKEYNIQYKDSYYEHVTDQMSDPEFHANLMMFLRRGAFRQVEFDLAIGEMTLKYKRPCMPGRQRVNNIRRRWWRLHHEEGKEHDHRMTL